MHWFLLNKMLFNRVSTLFFYVYKLYVAMAHLVVKHALMRKVIVELEVLLDVYDTNVNCLIVAISCQEIRSIPKTIKIMLTKMVFR